MSHTTELYDPLYMRNNALLGYSIVYWFQKPYIEFETCLVDIKKSNARLCELSFYFKHKMRFNFVL